MKKVAIVGLGWLGMPLAMSLAAKGWQVTGSKTTRDGVEAARMCGIDGVELRLEPELICDTDELDELMNVDALVTLPARRSGERDVLLAGGAGDCRQRPRTISRASFSPAPPPSMALSTVRRKHRAPSGDRQRPGAERAGRLAAQSAARRWISYVWPGWWGRGVIRGASLPVNPRRMASTGLILCTLRMLSVQ